MARADYEEQLRRHAGHWDVLPDGLPIPSLTSLPDGESGSCQGVVDLTDSVLAGNRWPAVSGALLAEAACRCATLAMLARSPTPNIREIAVRFRKAVPVADPRTRPRVADAATALLWSATSDDDAPGTTILVEMTRPLSSAADPVVTVTARATFDACNDIAGTAQIERRITAYLAALPRRLALPAYEPGWSADEIRGSCAEAPGSLLGVAEQALGDAGKIVRGNGIADDLDESMLLADMTYRWLEPVHDGLASYIARAGTRQPDNKGRTWVKATATLSIAGHPVGEGHGSVVFRSVPRRG